MNDAHAIALREQIHEVAGGPDGLEGLGGHHVHDDHFVVARQIQNVIDGSFALAVPKHETVIGSLRHRVVLQGVVVEPFGTTRGHNLTRRPVPRIVPAVVLHAVNENMWIRLAGKVPLNSLVGAIGVTDEDVESLLDHRVETGSHFLRKLRDLS